MAIAEPVRQRARTHPRVVTAVLSVIGYVVVISSFLNVIPFPELSRNMVALLSNAIAVINTAALFMLLAGWWFIKQGEVRNHKWSMLISFALIMLFLVLYIWKQAGGFTKGFVVSQGQFLAQYATLITYTYWGMLAIHVLLSIIAVPVVLHAVVLGLTHSIEELPRTIHPRVGKIAVVAWAVSLALGIITYLMLNHIYGWEMLRGSV